MYRAGWWREGAPANAPPPAESAESAVHACMLAAVHLAMLTAVSNWPRRRPSRSLWRALPPISTSESCRGSGGPGWRFPGPLLRASIGLPVAELPRGSLACQALLQPCRQGPARPAAATAGMAGARCMHGRAGTLACRPHPHQLRSSQRLPFTLRPAPSSYPPATARGLPLRCRHGSSRTILPPSTATERCGRRGGNRTIPTVGQLCGVQVRLLQGLAELSRSCGQGGALRVCACRRRDRDSTCHLHARLLLTLICRAPASARGPDPRARPCPSPASPAPARSRCPPARQPRRRRALRQAARLLSLLLPVPRLQAMASRPLRLDWQHPGMRCAKKP